MGQKMWGYRCAFVALAASALSTLATAEDDVAHAEQEIQRFDSDAATQRIEAILVGPLRTPLEFVEAPLNQIVEVLVDEYDIPIQFDNAALDAVASSPDVETTIRIGNVSLRKALDLMLRNAGEDLTYIVDDEVLLITTQEEAEKRLEVRVFRVDDLVSNREGVLSWSDEADFDSLIDLIVATVEHESWMENGTGEGEIQPFRPGMIVVSQTRRVHEQIDQLLYKLRSSKGQVDQGLAEAREAAADKPMTRSIAVHDESIANCQATRKTIREAILNSVEWDRTVEGVENEKFFLNVLPNRVLVRHVPEVVRQVEQVVRDIVPTEGKGQGSHGCLSGMSGGIGGTPPAESSTSTPPSSSTNPGSSNAAGLAEPTTASEDDNQRRQPNRGGGFF